MKVAIPLTVALRALEAERIFLAHCIELDLYAAGPTKGGALNSLDEKIEAQVGSTSKSGELGGVLRRAALGAVDDSAIEGLRVAARIPIRTVKKPGRFVASCPLLDVHFLGDTAEQARKNLAEALSAFVAACAERGVLEEVFQEYRPEPCSDGGFVIRGPYTLPRRPVRRFRVLKKSE